MGIRLYFGAIQFFEWKRIMLSFATVCKRSRVENA